MTYPVSGFDDSTHISTTVKWYDPAKGYGFLVPDDGSPDIYCRAPALAAVGLETLLSRGGRRLRDGMPGLRGFEVSRIISVDFSATTPRQAPFANVRGNGRMAAGAGRAEAWPRRLRPHDPGHRQVVSSGQGLRLPGARGRLRRRVLPPDRRTGVRSRHAAPGRGGKLRDRAGRSGTPGVADPLGRAGDPDPFPADRGQPFDARYSGPASCDTGVLGHGAARDGQILRPGEGVRLRRARRLAAARCTSIPACCSVPA